MESLSIPLLPLAGLVTGGWSLAFLFGFLVYRGKLVSEREHLQAMAYRDSVIEVERAEKVMWREAAKVSADQAEAMLTGLATQEQLLRGLMDQKGRQ